MTGASSEILLFQLGARVYAAEVFDVRRIGSIARREVEGAVGASALGEPLQGNHGIVVSCGQDGDRTLIVDQVLGVRQVTQDELRPLPPLAALCLATSAIAGLALVDEVPTLLVDLSTLIQEELRGNAAQPERGLDHA